MPKGHHVMAITTSTDIIHAHTVAMVTQMNTGDPAIPHQFGTLPWLPCRELLDTEWMPLHIQSDILENRRFQQISPYQQNMLNTTTGQITTAQLKPYPGATPACKGVMGQASLCAADSTQSGTSLQNS